MESEPLSEGSHYLSKIGDHRNMDFFCGPAVLHLDGEEFDVHAFIDSARAQRVEDWGGYIEVEVSDLLRFRAFGSSVVYLRIPGSPARDIEIVSTDRYGMIVGGLGRSPLPLSVQKSDC